MKQLIVILALALILPLSGCINQGRGWGYYPDSPFYGLRQGIDRVENWELRLPGTRALERKLENLDTSPWNPKGMAPGSCGAAYICDDEFSPSRRSTGRESWVLYCSQVYPDAYDECITRNTGQ